ncbi:uncharacterized protein LAESUDRAFT_693011 [Laetiporus sulphureus 93-53]|uniref:Peptidase C14 caspase domain-containing protein n=1 Tax=Laetiporus sulphureus 93-53 TaxID=1314785 RepID=A0A165GRQ8_9APHY|nr:uncharacterized protein LAESUDRAFT_693011 [Laetiporus sulphureus 93-53]KZT10716.1 hypothetical protein LAESUDRAFT_693011 [Laetiporus sulphureus 93-53]
MVGSIRSRAPTPSISHILHVTLSKMATRVFALIIGIDNYKSGNIWNLQSCVDDAKNIKRWLTHDLHVPRDQICLLLNAEATKRKIEETFMSHLVNNPAIEPGDAIFIYFSGHGSRVRAPPHWFENGRGEVEVLCPYDHDTRTVDGRIAGISDRSLYAMIDVLCTAKGDNITLMLDTCFALPRTPEGTRERMHVRYTPTNKASPADLISSLWKGASLHAGQKGSSRGFTSTSRSTHVTLAACGSGSSAMESKLGGNFTNALMTLKDRMAIHKLTYTDLIHAVSDIMDDHQHAISLGRHTDRIPFDGVPFLPDAHYVAIDLYDHEKVRVDAGAIHGIMEGTEFSIHQHNRRGSLNPVLATYSAVEIHPTWCLARRKSAAKNFAREGWARITRWNNRTPFRVHIRKSLLSIIRRCHLKKQITSNAEKAASQHGMNILRVKSATQADISVKLRRRELVVERHDPMISSNCRHIIQLPSKRTNSDLRIIHDAARFHLHLHRKNPARPLLGRVTMELYRLDASTWTRTSGNLLVNGKAEIVDDGKNSIYAVVIHNYSDHDLWPYLAYMDASGYGINMVYHPDSAAVSNPPLRRHDHLVIGSDTADSEALTFSLVDGADTGAGFLKLFVSSVPTPMTFIEQGVPSPITPTLSRSGRSPPSSSETEIWDSVVACVTVIRKSEKDS